MDKNKSFNAYPCIIEDKNVTCIISEDNSEILIIPKEQNKPIKFVHDYVNCTVDEENNMWITKRAKVDKEVAEEILREILSCQKKDEV